MFFPKSSEFFIILFDDFDSSKRLCKYDTTYIFLSNDSQCVTVCVSHEYWSSLLEGVESYS